MFKHELPHKQLFDELRLFDPGPISGPYVVDGVRIGSPICEDAWWQPVTETLAETGAEILVVPNGSPYHRDKLDLRMGHMVARVHEGGLPLAYVNMVGGQDDQVYDGASFVLNPGGHKVVQMAPFDEGLVHVDFTRTAEGWRAERGEMIEGLAVLHTLGDDVQAVRLDGGAQRAVRRDAADRHGAAERRCGLQARAAEPERGDC